jgi:hypothetical protein
MRTVKTCAKLVDVGKRGTEILGTGKRSSLNAALIPLVMQPKKLEGQSQLAARQTLSGPFRFAGRSAFSKAGNAAPPSLKP